MNTSIKRFAAVLFVASALSGAAQAQFDQAKFSKHAENKNTAMMFVGMRSDLGNLAFYSQTTQEIQQIFAAIEKIVVAVVQKDANSKPAVLVAVKTFENILINRAKDYTKVVELAKTLSDKISTPKKAGLIAQGLAYGAKKLGAVMAAPGNLVTKIKSLKSKTAAAPVLDVTELPAKKAAFNAAFEAVVNAAFDKKAVQKGKDLNDLIAKEQAFESFGTESKEESKARTIAMTAMFSAMIVSVEAVKQADKIAAEVATIANKGYGYFGSEAKSTKAIARATANIVKAQEKVNGLLNDVTIAGKDIIIGKLNGFVAQANAAAAAHPVVK